VSTDNPIAHNGTVVLIPKSKFAQENQLSFAFYDKEARPWGRDIIEDQALSEDILYDYDSERWGVLLSELEWNPKQNFSEEQTLNLLVRSQDNRIQLVKNLQWKESNETGSFFFPELATDPGELIATTAQEPLNNNCTCTEPDCCPPVDSLPPAVLESSPLMVIDGYVDLSRNGNLILTDTTQIRGTAAFK
jgi:hypothetical protein